MILLTKFYQPTTQRIQNENALILYCLAAVPVVIFVIALCIPIIMFIIYCRKPEYQRVKCCQHPSKELEKTETFPCGLKNKSSVCYMNAMIQAVASSDILIKEFEKLKQSQRRNSSLFIFVNLLRNINKSCNSKEAINANTKLLEELIESIGWNKPSQQDAFDLFSALIKSIHDDNKNLDKFQMPIKIKLVHRFTGMDIPDKVQDHLGLSVGLCGNYSKRPGESLEYLIQEHFSSTKIDEDSLKTTQMFFYQQAPDVLLIHIQANKWDHKRGEMVKPEYYVRYDKDMTLLMDIVTEIGSKIIKQERVSYKLKSVVSHLGTILGGHYVTYREYNGCWLKMNDEDVRRVEINQEVVPYIMIYERNGNNIL